MHGEPSLLTQSFYTYAKKQVFFFFFFKYIVILFLNRSTLFCNKVNKIKFCQCIKNTKDSQILIKREIYFLYLTLVYFNIHFVMKASEWNLSQYLNG